MAVARSSCRSAKGNAISVCADQNPRCDQRRERTMNASNLNSVAMASVLALLVLLPNARALADGCPAPSFAAPVMYDTGEDAYSLAVGDFNGDGKLDLAVAIPGSENIVVLLGNGDGTFQPTVNFNAKGHPKSIAAGDLNADDRLDLVVVNGGSTNISVLLGNGDGT